jgi:endonuclease YncB( thermonuclease family)
MPNVKRQQSRRLPRFSWAEIRLMLLAGLLLGMLTWQAAWRWPAFDAPPAAPIDMPSAGPVRVIDGDTFDYDGMRVRIADIDTPEVNGRCPYETRLAARATQRMRTLLAAGPFELHPLGSGRDTDRYGRKLRIVTRGGQSLGDVLVVEGLARTWTGRREPWCT